MKYYALILFFVFGLLPGFAHGQEAGEIVCGRQLSGLQVQHIETGKALLGEATKKSIPTIVKEINGSRCPAMQALMFEATARTYADLIKEYDLTDAAAQERLFQKIQMNMAFLQFTGENGKKGRSRLNRLICRKLKGYLPEGILSHPNFYIDPFK